LVEYYIELNDKVFETIVACINKLRDIVIAIKTKKQYNKENV